VQEIKESNRLLVKVGKTTLATGNVAETITGVFKKEFPGNAFVVESSTEIGPSIGDKLKKDTLSAVGLSMLGIVIYIAWRFNTKFGIGAILATLHDILAMFAAFYVLASQPNLLSASGDKVLEARYVVVATGAEPAKLGIPLPFSPSSIRFRPCRMMPALFQRRLDHRSCRFIRLQRLRLPHRSRSPLCWPWPWPI
jgi:hypothetical protein